MAFGVAIISEKVLEGYEILDEAYSIGAVVDFYAGFNSATSSNDNADEQENSTADSAVSKVNPELIKTKIALGLLLLAQVGFSLLEDANGNTVNQLIVAYFPGFPDGRPDLRHEQAGFPVPSRQSDFPTADNGHPDLTKVQTGYTLPSRAPDGMSQDDSSQNVKCANNYPR